ncbi:hypothetical protein HU200_040315 [Digitaria exilis]|uniref:Uncharacterized protein n=1 Tax=Digitaria exilis TaxID=1010633 RepID=A0A835B7G3_9POAL|nr:hypothetical protein HU200_040315 [Digitaria exilis]
MHAGTQAADSSDSSSPPAMARRGGPIPPPLQPPKSTKEDRNCPLIKVPDLVDACRRAPGLRACAAECIVYHYRGGYCDVSPNGRPGDCFCGNCLAEQQRISVGGRRNLKKDALLSMEHF